MDFISPPKAEAQSFTLQGKGHRNKCNTRVTVNTHAHTGLWRNELGDITWGGVEKAPG